MSDLADQRVRPLLARFAVTRTGASALPGRYSAEFDAWTVEGTNGPVPIIEASGIYDVIPITKVRGEREYPGAAVLLETVTKTAAQLERDDTSPRMFSDLLELSTKTETTPERDD